MKKLIFIVFLFLSVAGIAQSFVEGDSLVIYGGGNFENNVQSPDPINDLDLVNLRSLNTALSGGAVEELTDPATDEATSTAVIDTASGVVITLTTTGNSQTLQTPTVLDAGKTFYVVNSLASGSNTITVDGFILDPGEYASFIWSGASWAYDSDRQPFDLAKFSTSYTPTGLEPVGSVYWDDVNRAFSVVLGNGVILQVGQESLKRVYNNSGATIENGKVCGGSGINGQTITVEKASNGARYTALLFTTEEIPNGSYGFGIEISGTARMLNTSGLSLGLAYVDDIAGEITNTKPEFPSYEYAIGVVSSIDAVTGTVEIRLDGVDFYNTLQNSSQGTIREPFNFLITSDGTTITGSLETSFGTGGLTGFFSDEIVDISEQTITMTAGTDNDPQNQVVYIPKSTKTLTLSTGTFPTEEHIRITDAGLWTASRTQLYGAMTNRNWNDPVQGIDGRGDRAKTGERFRQQHADFEDGSGGAITVDIQTGAIPDNVYLSVTGFRGYQKNSHTVPAWNMETGDPLWVVNDPDGDWELCTDLNQVLEDATGSSLSGDGFSLVLGCILNKTGEPDQFCVFLPRGSWANPNQDEAVGDALGYADYRYPTFTKGKYVLLGRINFQVNNGLTEWTLLSVEDLRGSYPSATGKGTGSGGGIGIQTLLEATDYPNAYATHANKIVKVGSGETATEFSLSTISDAGTLNIPSGQEYQIGGVGLTTSNIPEGSNPYDKTVTITGAGINNVTGTYPNFTITGTEAQGIDDVLTIDPLTTQNIDFEVNSTSPTEIGLRWMDSDIPTLARAEIIADKYLPLGGVNAQDIVINNYTSDLATQPQENYRFQATGQPIFDKFVADNSFPITEIAILGYDASGNIGSVPLSELGVTDHSLLSNLDYASSGHTGFASTSSNSFTGEQTVEYTTTGSVAMSIRNSYSAGKANYAIENESYSTVFRLGYDNDLNEGFLNSINNFSFQYNGSEKFELNTNGVTMTDDLQIDGLKDSDGDLGASGQMLSSTGSGTNWITSSGGSTAWGTLTGTLSDQTDLQSALDAKLSTEVDGSISNEGFITVGPGGANSATIQSNTSGSQIATIEGGTNVTITENTTTDIITISANTGGGLSDPMTTAYDIIYRNGSNSTTRLGKGADGTFLGVASGVLGYFTPSGGSSSGTAGSIQLSNGSNGFTSQANLDYISGVFDISNAAGTTGSGRLDVGSITVLENTTLGTPSSGRGKYGAKTDGKPYFVNDAGTEYDLSASGGSSSNFLSDNVLSAASASTVTITMSTYGSAATQTMTGNFTLNLHTLADGQTGEILLRQDATGSRTFTLNTYSDAGSTGLTEIYSGGLENVNPTASSYTAVKYKRLGSIVLIDMIWYE